MGASQRLANPFNGYGPCAERFDCLGERVARVSILGQSGPDQWRKSKTRAHGMGREKVGESMSLSVGQEVWAVRDIVKEADDHSPIAMLAERGERLIVRSNESEHWYCYVSHPEITDNSFGVEPSEITSIDPKTR